MFRDGFHVAFIDGSVSFLSKEIDADTLRALITRAGGENVRWDKYRLDKYRLR